MKNYVMVIVMNIFLGYLWVLYINHITELVNSIKAPFIVSGFFMILGTFLFYEIFNRITPLNNLKISHPIKITGVASFALVVIIHAFFINLV